MSSTTTTKPMCVEVLRGKGEGLRAHNQFLPLVFSTQSARVHGQHHSAVSLLGAHLVKQLWDEWVVGCQRVMVVVAVMRRKSSSDVAYDNSLEWGAERVSFRFGISPLLMGITMDVVVVRRESAYSGVPSLQWIDGNKWLHVQRNRSVHIRDTRRSGIKTVFRTGGKTPEKLWIEANGKWLVQIKRRERRLAVCTLENDSPTVVVVEIPGPYSSCQVFVLNKVNLSEAVMVVVSEEGGHCMIMVCDISQTYSTETLHILSTIPLGDFPPSMHINNLLVIHDQNNDDLGIGGQRVFIVDAQENERNKSALFCVQSNGAPAIEIYSGRKCRRSISQVGGSLFSVLNTGANNRLDIWDWKNVATKRRRQVVRSIPQARGRAITGGGFIVLVEGNDRYLQVLEGSSGLLAVSFEFVGWEIKKLCQTSSFLW